uniref:TAP42-like family, putative n=1 Tax=Theileria annulata TaxID=5874 RepID=A0A3B0MWD7_THEAN
MVPEDTSSDFYLFDRLFNRTFSEYWTLFWQDYDFNKFNSVRKELNECLDFLQTHSLPQYFQQHSVSILVNKVVEAPKAHDTSDEPEFQRNIEKERLKKLRVVDELQQSFELLNIGCIHFDLISKNEQFEDVHTENLKYLMLPYLSAHVLFERPNMENRFSILKKVQIYLFEFMNTLSQMDILRPEELQLWETKFGKSSENSEMGVGGRRNEDGRSLRINQASFERDLKKSLTEIFSSSGSIENFIRFRSLEDSDREEFYRNTLLSILRLFSIQSLNHLNSIEMELPFVERRELNKLAFSNEPKTDVTTSSSKPWFLHIDTNSQLDPTLVRSLYKRMVFLPGHNLPTISLDECARIEMEMDVKTIGVKNRPKKRKSSSFDNSEEESEKSSVCTDEERNWDDWKDDHPKGQGNKDVNIG